MGLRRSLSGGQRRGPGPLFQPEPFCRFPGPGHRSLDLVVAGRVPGTGPSAVGSPLGRRSLWLLLASGGVVLLALLVHGYQPVEQEFASLASASLDQWDPQEGRRRLWSAAIAAIRQYPVLGVGVGAHRE